MREILERIGALLPTYLRDALGLIGGPKKFVANKIRGKTDSLSESIVFLAISSTAAMIMLSPSAIQGSDLIAIIGRFLLQLIILSVVGAWSVWLSWKVVGGTAPVTHYVTIYCFYSGIAFLIFGTTFVVCQGIMRTFDRGAIELVAANGGRYMDFYVLYRSQLSSVYVLLFAVSGLALAGWGLAGWGAYRELNRATRTRSVVALALTLMFGALVMIVSYFLARGMA